MARALFSRILATATLAIGAVAGFGACVEDEGMFYVTRLGDPDVDIACDEFPDAGVAFSGIVIDKNIGFSTSGVRLCLNNKLKSSRRGGVETSNIIVNEVEISFSDGGGRRQAVIGLLSADTEDGTPGVSTEDSIVFEAFTATEFANYVGQASAAGGVFETIASVRVFGRTTGGMDVDTPEYFFPVRIKGDPVQCYCDVPDTDPTGLECPDSVPFTEICL